MPNSNISNLWSRLFLGILFILIATSCKIARHVGSSSPGNPHDENIHISKTSKSRRHIIEEARTWIGTPYKYGGAEKGVGADCSGMVMCVYEDATGIKIPRNSAKQAEFCLSIDSNEVKAGDLVFFATGKDAEKVSHVGIVIDASTFIHASSSKGVVESNLLSAYFQRTFIMFGRVPTLDN